MFSYMMSIASSVISRIISLLRPTLVNKTSHKFTGKLGQKVDKTKCGYIYKIILQGVPKKDRF